MSYDAKLATLERKVEHLSNSLTEAWECIERLANVCAVQMSVITRAVERIEEISPPPLDSPEPPALH